MVICFVCGKVLGPADATLVAHVLGGHPMASLAISTAIGFVPVLARGNAVLALLIYGLLALLATWIARGGWWWGDNWNGERNG